MPSLNKKAFFADYTFNVGESVYVPAEDSFLFAENLDVKKSDVVLDMGAGCGILGIIAADKALKVVAVDVNPYAVRCAGENAKLNGVAEKMCIVRGDLFTSLKPGKRFDLILFNAPYVPVEHEDGSWVERAWSGGFSGRRVIDRFIFEVPKHLKQSGRVFLMQSTLAGVNETVLRFNEQCLNTRVVAQRPLPFFETLVLLRAERSS